MSMIFRGIFSYFYCFLLMLSFCDIETSRKNIKRIIIFTVIQAVIQGFIFYGGGAEAIERLYPLHGHLPIILFVAFALKEPLGKSFVSFMTGYVCLELPNATSKVLALLLGLDLDGEIFCYCVSAIVFFKLILKYISRPLATLFSSGRHQRLLFGSIPIAYYLWCHVADVYSDYLEENGYQIALLISGLFCIMFLIFAVSEEIKREADAKKQEALEATKAKSAFLAKMSHEIRTPINAVLGIDEMILRECDDPQIRDYARKIKASGNALLYLISDILDLSKIEAGKMEIVKNNYEIQKLLSDVLSMNVSRIEAKGLSYSYEIDQNIPSRLFGDDMRLRQVLINLITNAIKYTDTGSLTLVVSIAERTDNNVKLHFAVKDTGIGIKEADQKLLFTSFQRVDLSHNKTIEGTGLGLSITQQLLQLMDSELKLISEYGKGSEFYFDIDQKVVDETPLGHFSPGRTSDSNDDIYKEGFTAESVKILVVDDYSLNLLVFKGLMKESKMRIDTAESGMQALEMIGKECYDLVFLDHMMPEMDGIEVLKRIKTNKELRANAQKVVVLTANAINGAKEGYLAAGFNDYLVKPVSGQALEECIRRWIPANLIHDIVPDEPEQISVEPTFEILEPEDYKEDNVGAGLIEILEPEDYKDDSEGLIEILEPEDFVDEDNDSGSSLGYCPLIDMKVALGYSGGDERLLKELFKAFLQGNFEKDLKEYYESQDWDKYEVTIHGLKSAAKAVGAMHLSENAKTSELAIKEQHNPEISKQLHPDVMRELNELLEYIKGIM